MLIVVRLIPTMASFPLGSVVGAVAFGAASLGCFYVAQKTSRGALRVAELRVLTVQEAVAVTAAAADPSDPDGGNDLVAVRGSATLAPGSAELTLPEDFSLRVARPLLAFREEFVLDIVTSAMQRKEARRYGEIRQTPWALQGNDGQLLLVSADLVSSPPLRVLGRSVHERVDRQLDIGVRLRASGVVSLVDVSEEEQVVSMERVPHGLLAGTGLTAVAVLGRDEAGRPTLLPARGEDVALCGVGEGSLADRVADLRSAARLFRVLGGVCLVVAGFFAGNAARAFAARRRAPRGGNSSSGGKNNDPSVQRYPIQVHPLASLPAVPVPVPTPSPTQPTPMPMPMPVPSAPPANANASAAGAWPVPLSQVPGNAPYPPFGSTGAAPYPPASTTGYNPAAAAAPASPAVQAAPVASSHPTVNGYAPSGAAINPSTWPYAAPNAGGSSGPAYRTVDEVAPRLPRK